MRQPRNVDGIEDACFWGCTGGKAQYKELQIDFQLSWCDARRTTTIDDDEVLLVVGEETEVGWMSRDTCEGLELGEGLPM